MTSPRAPIDPTDGFGGGAGGGDLVGSGDGGVDAPSDQFGGEPGDVGGANDDDGARVGGELGEWGCW